MKKINVGIDISKEKCNLCYRSGLEIVREEECSNEVRALKKALWKRSSSAPSTPDDTSTL